MARRHKTTALAFEAISVEGSLMAPAMLARIAAQTAEGQKDADYQVKPGLTLREEISRYFRIGQAQFRAFRASETPSHLATLKFVEDLLRDVFGFADLKRVGQRTLDEKVFALTLEALEGRAPVIVVPPSDGLDKASDNLPGDGRRRSAASALQDWLNASDGALWGMCTNGLTLRLVRDNESLTRPAYIEADLRQMFEDEAFADFTLLWLLFHASRFGVPVSAVTDCALERWREAGTKEGVAARERLGLGFEAALLALGNGFLVDARLRDRLLSGELALTDYFGQLLHLVYRLIFLFVAEDRNLLHPPAATPSARRLYAEGYSLSGLRDRSLRRINWDLHQDRWQGLVVTFEALRRGESRLGLPALGGLFGLLQMDDLAAAQLPNRALMEAIFRLAWLRDDQVLAQVNWRDMETEELGSVYEGLLELTPRLGDDGRRFYFAEGAETKGNARKTSGSYYTPDSLVQALLDSALDPVLDRVEAEANDPAEALLGVTVIDPACGSGHFLLAAARRIATRVARARAGGVASAEDYRHALRDVARRSIHGVDRNPMAVELSKVALWIETVEPGKPLGFLDANIRCGDALLGVFDMKVLQQGIPDEAYKPLTGDDKDAAKILLKDNRAQREREGDLAAGFTEGEVVREAERVLALPEDDVEDIEKKRLAYEGWRRGKAAARGWMAANLYVAAFLRPKHFRETAMATARVPDRVPTTVDVRSALAGRVPHPETLAAAMEVAADARAFHWPLEFPSVMASGGFDLVIGNPPWERIKLQDHEFFASRDADIADAPNTAARRRKIAALRVAAPDTREHRLFKEYETAQRMSDAAVLFAGCRFPLTATGNMNTYALFTELALTGVNRRGYVGLVVPSGITTDAQVSGLFRHLVHERRLLSVLTFGNAGDYFPDTTTEMFTLVTLASNVRETKAGFHLRQVGDILDERRAFALDLDLVALLNPNTRTATAFRARRDAEIVRGIYKASSPLVAEEQSDGNPWHVAFMRMFDMATDSGAFFARTEIADAVPQAHPALAIQAHGIDYLPLYEGKMMNQYDHRFGTYSSLSARPGKGGTIPNPTGVLKADPAFEVQPWYYVPTSSVRERLTQVEWTRDWYITWRFGTKPTNERTLISSVVPACALPHVLPAVLPIAASPQLSSCLIANLNSLVADYVCRNKMSRQGLDIFIIKQLPIIVPSSYSPADLAFVTPRVLELTYTSHSMAPFARDLGYSGPPFAWDEERRALLRAELDAFYARKYGLTRDELRYILDPADVMGPDYPSETFRVLKTNEIKKYGEFRTARLVLAAWDRMAADQAFASLSVPSH